MFFILILVNFTLGKSLFKDIQRCLTGWMGMMGMAVHATS